MPSGGRRGGPGGAQVMEMLMSRFDTDKDGAISLEEAPDRMKQRFERLDGDGDKSVTKEELQAAFAKMGEGRRGSDGKAKGDGKGQGKGKKGKGSRQGQRCGQGRPTRSWPNGTQRR